jgi:hypothetical protein
VRLGEFDVADRLVQRLDDRQRRGAITGVMGTTLLLAASGQTFMLSNQPIWVRPIAIALSVPGPAPSRIFVDQPPTPRHPRH